MRFVASLLLLLVPVLNVVVTSSPVSATTSVPEPIALYLFDEQTGAATIEDEVRGAAGLGTVYGSPIFQPGKVGNAMCLNGTVSQYATAPLIGNGLQEFTISAWAKVDTVTTWGSVVKNWGDPAVGAFHLGLDQSSGKWSNYIGLTTSSSSQVSVVDSTATTLNEWHYLVTTASASDGLVKLYVDGVKVAETSFSGTIAQQGNLMSFGVKLNYANNPPTASTSGVFDGCIDEVSFWDVALSQSQVDLIQGGGGGVLAALESSQSQEPQSGTQESPARNSQSVDQAALPQTGTAQVLTSLSTGVAVLSVGALIALASARYRKKISV